MLKISTEEFADIIQRHNQWKGGSENLDRFAPAHERPLVRVLADALLSQPKHQVVIGPRQAGKSTVLRQTIRSLLGEGVREERIFYVQMDAMKLRPETLESVMSGIFDIASENVITDQDVESAEVLVEASLDRNFYRVRTDRLTEKELEYLRAMAQLGQGPHRSGDIAALLKSTSRKVAPLRDRLIKKGMIFSPSHGDTAFSVPLFDEYLRKTAKQP